jgi:hypothetical protein
MNGIVVGGWEFVWAAYILTAVAFAAYGVTVITGLREQRRRHSAEREAR